MARTVTAPQTAVARSSHAIAAKCTSPALCGRITYEDDIVGLSQRGTRDRASRSVRTIAMDQLEQCRTAVGLGGPRDRDEQREQRRRCRESVVYLNPRPCQGRG